jgi:hypothetical protein
MTGAAPRARVLALASNYFHVRDGFTDEQWDHVIATRRFVNEVLPQINQYWEAAELPWPLLRRLPELGLLGEDIQGYGFPAMGQLTAIGAFASPHPGASTPQVRRYVSERRVSIQST